MRKLFVLFAITFLLSGCTVAHFAYLRNLSECDVAVDLVFPQGKVAMPDSIYIPYSNSCHLINSQTYKYMNDSIVVKRLGPNRMSFILPQGAMVMYDRIAAKKFDYVNPETIEIQCPGSQNGLTKIYFDPNSTGDKKFKQKGHNTWFDIY